MSVNAHILVVGRDPMLLQTRKLILGTYFEVEGAARVAEAESLLKVSDFDLVVLCHTLTEVECRQIVDMVQRQVRLPQILMLTAQNTSPKTALQEPRLMMEEGPFVLLKRCADMLGFMLRRKGRAVRLIPVDPVEVHS